jgi:DNA-binding GntR family transcriptional regulator
MTMVGVYGVSDDLFARCALAVAVAPARFTVRDIATAAGCSASAAHAALLGLVQLGVLEHHPDREPSFQHVPLEVLWP